ncbi:MAG: enoyl-CoA hydratase [Phenylobacterium sp.]|nr:enoyl-CoA hydratase [Phenylobacterium sp.]
MNANVTIRREGAVAEIVFANPSNNHANVGLLRGIAEALEALDRETAIRAVVLASDGKPFCAGADLVQTEGGGVGGSGADPIREFYDQALRLFATQKPIVAAIQGAAVGAGLGLAVAADFRVAAPEARFAGNFTKLGYHPGFGLTCTLPRVVGHQRAALMLLTGRRFKPEEVLPWGLVDEIVQVGALRAAAHRLAAEIAENAPLATVATRKTLRDGLLAEVTAVLAHEHAQQALLRQTEDYAEGVRSVNERRPGNFVGR